MPRAVRFNEYGSVDVLQVVNVSRPIPGPGQVLVEVKAAGINPVDTKIREGKFGHTVFPAEQGMDFAGVVTECGPDTEGVAVGDEVIGFKPASGSHAEFLISEAAHLTRRPADVPWPAAGALFVAGATAYAAVRAVAVTDGDTVVVSGAAGGVGSIAVQLAKYAGATVIGLASERNHAWLAEHGVIPVAYGDGVAERIREVSHGRIDAFIDTFGSGYVELALELGVKPDRINTIVDFAAVEKHGVKTEGSNDAASADVLAELAGLIDKGVIEIPIAGVYPLEGVRDAYRQLEQGHTRGKIVLTP